MLVDIFATAILPIVAVATVGFVLGRARGTDPGPLNTAVVYVLAPALVLHSLATTTLSAETLLGVAAAVVAFVLGMSAVAEAVGRVLGYDTPARSALVLVAAFSNSGNYGIPVSAFAFGDVGRSTAVLYLGVQSVLMYTVGVYVAARSAGGGGLAGVKRVFRIPLVYAVAAALLARWLGVVPAATATSMRTLQLVGDASIPVMLLILGIQLANSDYGAAVSRTVTPTVLKMAVAPALAAAVAVAVGFGTADVARVYVLECAMPAAVTPLILSVEFANDAEIGGVAVPEFVGATIFVTTLVSVPVLTVLVFALQSAPL